MYFNQISVPGLGCQSYVIGCPAAKAMIVVDPKRDIQDYLDISREEGMAVTHIINTHLHADHVSGDQELRAATGADIYINDGVPIHYEHKPIEDGDTFTIGSAKVEVVFTPGHTPNSISLLVTDTTRSQDPQLLLTGDLLFVGDVGRPDLPGAEILDEMVENLYHSLYVKLADYPDHLEVFPAHGQGSLCGRGMSSKKSSTLGYERKANPMLGFSSFEDFKADITSAFPTRPKSFSHVIATNRGGANLLDACPTDKRLTPRQFEELIKDGAVVIDSRDGAAYGGYHIPGSINIGFEKQLANWVGMVVEPESDIVLVVDSNEDYERMVTELHRIGYDRIFGYLSGGIQAWLMSGRPLDSLAQVAPHDLAEQIQGDRPMLVDVRTDAEWKQGRLDDSDHLPLSDLLEGALPDAPKDQDMVMVCGSGYRSNIAASLLKKAGFTHVRSLAGGLMAWESSRSPVA